MTANRRRGRCSGLVAEDAAVASAGAMAAYQGATHTCLKLLLLECAVVQGL